MATQQLERTLGLRLVVVVVVGNIIGSGVYKKIAPMAAELHTSGWVLLCWLLAGAISLFGALSNAEVAGLLADTGGEYSYYQRIYNRFFAFMFGWSLFAVIQTAAISSLAYVFAQSLHSIVPLPPLLTDWADLHVLGLFYPFADFNIKLLALVTIVVLTWLNSLGLRAGVRFGTGILVLVFAGILLVIGAGLGARFDQIDTLSFVPVNGAPVTISAVFTAMMSAFWAYQGWATVGYLGGEVKNPHRNIPRGIAIGVIFVITLYLLVNLTYLLLLPVPQLVALHQAGNQIAAIEAIRSLWGNGGAVFISVLILISTLGCTNATILGSCRTYYAMAREGRFFRDVARLNRFHVPSRSLLYQAIWACLLVLSGTFDQLTDMIIFAVFIFYGATTLGVFILRRTRPDAPRPYRVWGYPVVPAIVILFCVGLVVNTFFSRPREAIMGLVLILTGVPMYFWFLRTGHETEPD